MAEAQGKEFLDAPDDGDAKDAAGEEEPADGTTVLTDSVDVPEIEEGFFVEPAAIILDKGFRSRWWELSSPEWISNSLACLINCVAGVFIGVFADNTTDIMWFSIWLLVIFCIIVATWASIHWSNLKKAIRTEGFGEAVRNSYSPKNDFEMLHYMARTGDVIAVRDLADRLRRGEDGAFYSPRSAVALYIYAAGKGDIAAKWELSECYEKGIGVEQNPAEAARWREVAEDAVDEI